MDRNSKEFRDRVNELLQQENKTPLRWHYCSFADDNGFRGGLFIQGHGITDIMIRSHRLGLNPGGEMYCVDIDDVVTDVRPEEKYRNRLLTKQELREASDGQIVNLDGEDR